MVSEDKQDAKQLEEFQRLIFVLSHEGQGNLLGLSDKGRVVKTRASWKRPDQETLIFQKHKRLSTNPCKIKD